MAHRFDKITFDNNEQEKKDAKKATKETTPAGVRARVERIEKILGID